MFLILMFFHFQQKSLQIQWWLLFLFSKKNYRTICLGSVFRIPSMIFFWNWKKLKNQFNKQKKWTIKSNLEFDIIVVVIWQIRKFSGIIISFQKKGQNQKIYEKNSLVFLFVSLFAKLKRIFIFSSFFLFIFLFILFAF